MPFQRGNKHGKGGAREGVGSKTYFEKRVEEAAQDIARKFVEDHVIPVLKAYLH